MPISTDLRFYISRIDEPNQAWEKLEFVFGKHNEIRGYQLENELLSLNPNDFSCIQDYLSKYKTLRILCTEWNIKREDKQCIYHIRSKLGPAYSVFVSAFYSMKESLNPTSYIEPSLESFCDSLIREQDKLIHMGKPYCPERKKSPSLPRNTIFAIICQRRVPNPLNQLLL